MNTNSYDTFVPDTQVNYNKCLAAMEAVFTKKSAEMKEADKVDLSRLFQKMINSEFCKETAALQEMLACKGYPTGSASTLEKAANLVKFWRETGAEDTRASIGKLFPRKEETPKVQADTLKKPEEERKQLFVTRDNVEKVAGALLRDEPDKKVAGQSKRVELSTLGGLNEADRSRFYIKARERIDAGVPLWVQVKEGDKQIYLSVSSLRKRLLLPYGEIYEAEKKGKLEELIAQQSLKIQQAMKVYQKNFAQFAANNKNANLKPELLLKVCLASHDLWPARKIPKPLDISGGTIATGAFITEAEQQLLVRIKQRTIHIIDLSTAKLVSNAGAMSTVFKAVDVMTDTPFAIKVGKQVTEKGASGHDTLVTEGKKLQLLAEKGATKAQEPPIMVVDTRTGKKGDMNRTGETYMVGKLFEGDMFDYLKKSAYNPASRVAIAKQVWEQFEELLDLGLYHADIKLDNYLVSTKSNPPEVRLIDWAGAIVDLSNPFQQNDITTHLYTPQVMANAIESWDRSQRIRGMICHDRFATAMCLFSLFAGMRPYESDKTTQRPTGEYQGQWLIYRKCSEELKGLFKDLLKLEVPQTDAELIAQNMDFRARWAKIVSENNFYAS